ncbi:hypothetical protein HS088_TW07G00023 [Tripterygium wilfordii]|uniref:DUF641 domain-containing protein n=1 Tax=Tripterygium wilfordii TaxID=458696 RepID=A0A7J7DDN9_TRIWF|nr:protein GRAVITROPIC IN THE LIGHT 1 [Tripterygium wilfordii]KAF5744452.1 hypothetical protein HS088_TW07G00023 [Tripterygium wilfordii]
MEYSTTKPSKSASNMSDKVSRFAKVCKLRSIGVFSSEDPGHICHYKDPNINGAPLVEDSSDAADETECDGTHVHLQPAEVQCKGYVFDVAEILKLFDIVSSLKLAYVQLQQAHIPYNPEKIIAADEVFVSKLKAICKIRRAYKEKQCTKPKVDYSRLDGLREEIEVNEGLLEKLKAQNKAKDDIIVRLGKGLQDLDLGNAILSDTFRQESLEKKNVKVLNVVTFEESFNAASKSIHDFGKPLINLMKASGWDLDEAADSIVEGVVYAQRSHKKYAFEAYIARRMFHGLTLKSFNVDDIMRFDDPIDALIRYWDSDFANFCRKKYLLVVHPMMELSFFGNLDQRMFVLSGKHPRTPFYQIFARMVKWVWVLAGIAASIDPNAKMFAVCRGSEFSDVYMEPAEVDCEGAVSWQGQQKNPKVGLMIIPGFKIGGTIVKARVYLSGVK